MCADRISVFNKRRERQMFERRDIWELSEQDPWHPIIEWYARAVAAMQARDGTDFSDPTSWRYLANIHGVDLRELPLSSWPRGATWNECQHNSWFFLPWHRIYLHYFEQIVRQTIVNLGGPDDWALPYWDYSDPDRENVRRLTPRSESSRCVPAIPIRCS
jgi:tyrosinase